MSHLSNLSIALFTSFSQTLCRPTSVYVYSLSAAHVEETNVEDRTSETDPNLRAKGLLASDFQPKNLSET